MTPKQKKIHTYIKTYLKENKMYAQIPDIAKGLNLCYSTIQWHLYKERNPTNLLKMGKVEKVRRGIYKAI